MKALIKLNFAAGLFFAATTIEFARTESPLLLLVNIAFLVGFCVLGVINLASIVTLWNRHGVGALAPFGSFAAAVVIWFFGGRYGTDLVLRGTPSRPDSFLRGGTREELTLMANQLIGNGFKEILLFPGKPTDVRMIAGRQQKDVRPEVLAALRRFGFQTVYVDDVQGIVQFSYNHLRHWYDYTWAKNGLSEQRFMPPTISEVDIDTWGQLIKIAKEGTSEKKQRDCEPGIAYFYLRDSLGKETLDRIAAYPSSSTISDQEKDLVLSALNKHVGVSSALAEHPQITYEQTSWLGQTEVTLNISGGSIGHGFWVVTLLKQLLSEGVITYAPDGRHLRIKTNLTNTERNQVEWLHVGLMNFIYSNFLEKRPHPFTKDLGGNWYFNE